MGLRISLQQYDYDTDTWNTTHGPITSPPYQFAGLSHGTYRLYVEIPTIFLSSGCGERDPGPILIYNIAGQWIGYAGYWSGDVNSDDYYSDPVIVGSTVEADIKYSFIDEPETGSPLAYDYGEQVIMDVSECKNFNLYWLAIFEQGPVYNRYKGMGWTYGIPSLLDLTQVWSDVTGWSFEPFHSYTVQFAIENADCINSSWNNHDETIFICPAGTGCRRKYEPLPITVVPNPASDQITLSGIDFEQGNGHRVAIYNLMGQEVLGEMLIQPQVNVANLPNGLYSVVVTQDYLPRFVSKLLIAH